jgi:hypothetical protein
MAAKSSGFKPFFTFATGNFRGDGRLFHAELGLDRKKEGGYRNAMHLGAGVLSYVSLLINETIIKMIDKRDELSVEAKAIDNLVCPPEKISF